MIFMGVLFLASAMGLFLHNEKENQTAGEAVAVLMPQIVDAINEQQMERHEQWVTEPAAAPQILHSTREKEMTVLEIDGQGYIGFVGLTSLNIELPVMADWSDTQLKTAPCRYTGSIYTDDLVIMAHNYDRHFGALSELRIGDSVSFTDMDAETTLYEVVALDVLAPTDIEVMTAGEYDLTLFTCTYGGKSRVTVRCNRIVETDVSA